MTRMIWCVLSKSDEFFRRCERRWIVNVVALLVLWMGSGSGSLTAQEVKNPAANVKADPPKAAPAAVVTEKAADVYTSRLFLAEADGSAPTQVTLFPGYTSQGSPEFSADGKLICFDVWKAGETHNNGQIALVNVDGSKPRVLTNGLMPSFSPGGRRITFSRPGSGVWIMSAEGPEVELVQLDAGGWGSSWAPDGRIAYAAGISKGDNLVVVSIVEGTRESLFNDETPAYRSIYWNMAWSPDSKRIAFKGITSEGKTEVGIVDARGEKFGLIRRPFTDVHESLSWSPDGSRIYVTKPCPERENRSQVYVFNPDKDEPLQLLEHQESERPAITAVSSPDGKKLLISCLAPVPPKAPAAKAP
jgi:TolB protein